MHCVACNPYPTCTNTFVDCLHHVVDDRPGLACHPFHHQTAVGRGPSKTRDTRLLPHYSSAQPGRVGLRMRQCWNKLFKVEFAVEVMMVMIVILMVMNDDATIIVSNQRKTVASSCLVLCCSSFFCCKSGSFVNMGWQMSEWQLKLNRWEIGAEPH